MNKGRFLATVLSVVDQGIEDVYDVCVPGLNAFDANGVCACTAAAAQPAVLPYWAASTWTG